VLSEFCNSSSFGFSVCAKHCFANGGEARKILKKIKFFSGFCDFFAGFSLQKNPGL